MYHLFKTRASGIQSLVVLETQSVNEHQWLNKVVKTMNVLSNWSKNINFIIFKFNYYINIE